MSTLPKEFLERMENLFSDKEYTEFIDAFDTEDERFHAFRLNKSKCRSKEELFDALNAKEAAKNNVFSKVAWEETGFYYDENVAPGKHPYHEAGLYYIQEPSAMAPVHFLDPRPKDHVLDLCAAPGGKSTQIAGALKGQGILVTNEINRDRAKILSLNIERMGIRNAMVVSEDSFCLSEKFEGYFNKILVDAPCSGEGMFRKNEIALSEWSLDNVKLCAQRQKEILDNAAKMLLPGGRIIYSTCTFSPEENEQNIYEFLLRHKDFHVKEVELIGGMENGRTLWVNADATADERALFETGRSVRLWPHKVRGEGHFLCVLERDGETRSDSVKSYVPGGRFVRAKAEQIKPFIEFAAETLKLSDGKIDVKNGDTVISLSDGDSLAGGFLSFGDQLYLAPSDMPSPVGLKVLRPGLHLGEVKKGRFEPSHALALVLNDSSCNLTFDIPSDIQDIRQYLNGQTLRLSSGDDLYKKKGWCLVTCDGYSIGWAKLAGGMLKNHYPKGLRINY